MKDNSVVDLFNNINKVRNHADLASHAVITTVEDKQINLVDSISLRNDEHELADIIEELELNLSSFLFDEDSIINQTIKNKLLNLNITINKLSKDLYYLNFGNFCIAFSL